MNRHSTPRYHGSSMRQSPRTSPPPSFASSRSPSSIPAAPYQRLLTFGRSKRKHTQRSTQSWSASWLILAICASLFFFSSLGGVLWLNRVDNESRRGVGGTGDNTIDGNVDSSSFLRQKPPSRQRQRRRISVSEESETQIKTPLIPYYLYGKYSDELLKLSKEININGSSIFRRKDMIRAIVATPTNAIVNRKTRDFATELDSKTKSRALVHRALENKTSELLPSALTWALPSPLLHGTRNHDCVALNDDKMSQKRGDHVQIMTLLGRYNRHVERVDLINGKAQAQTTEGNDPAGRPLNDLNHVSAVLVDVIDDHGDLFLSSDGDRPKQEIWLPCGFHGDPVNSEISSDYVRIIDVDTMEIRAGPKLPHSGGACTSLPVSVLRDEPPMICSFAGTRGKHDSGVFLPQTQCYDRKRKKWWNPFGELPYGLDHGNAVIVPAGRCDKNDPARVLILNFRTEPYGDIHPEVLASDIPQDRWNLEQLKRMDNEIGRKGDWYVYHNITNPFDRPENVPRDAAGIVVADGGRQIINFGGQSHDISMEEHKSTGHERKKLKFSMIRSFDVCEKKWNILDSDLGLSTFALQSCASKRLQVAFTCGGEAPLHNSNSDICFASHWNDLHIENQHEVVS